MLFRYRARNYPHTLTEAEQLQWDAFCKERLTGQQAGAGITLADYHLRLQNLRDSQQGKDDIINALDAYAALHANFE